METTLIVLAVLAGIAMASTATLALYAIYFMFKYKKAIYKDGYFQGLVEYELLEKLSANKEKETETQD